MKKIIIFEGIASSGKTTLESLLAEQLANSAIISEGNTLMPLIENKSQKIALAHLRKQLAEISKNPAENLLIDRFHLTHAFRTGSNLAAFSEIETDLKKIGHVITVLLTIEPAHIKERIEETMLRRKDSWKKGAQGSIEEKTTYYTKQQEQLVGLLRESQLSSIVIETTKKDWDGYTKEIFHNIS